MAETIDQNFAEEVLEWWIERATAALTDRYGKRPHTFCDVSPATDELLNREFPTRRVIGVVLGIKNVDELVRPIQGRAYIELQSGIVLARRALGHLRSAHETSLFISGTSAPTMAADALHRLVWNAAADLWGDGHYSSAVQRAATFLNAHVQDLTGRRDVSDNNLMAQVFSPSPPEIGKPRLRWPGEDTDLTVKAMRTGILQFAQGCFAAIRNPATHGTVELDPQEALEQLAILSTLARWIEQCELVRFDGE